ncbi:cell division initiation protein [Lactobacillus hamsteri DSM 5661 = JCM 6256]|uniref:Cell division initiation protein n=2 Tax=Lactobacillus hamsteri TaxID=96565 RepID=A0A0R1Y4D4_9LACO|nr:cell division initiation protein [Lactobacillus hamsteri DSM 5661 = JCM 6256]
MDIHNKEFKHRGRNGYDRYEVDSFLDQIVDDYGDSLDQVVDLKNQIASLNQKIDNLQSRVDEYDKKEEEVNQILVSAQKSANRMIADAKKQAERTVSEAKKQAQTDTDYQRQQQEVLSDDYKRLKKEVGEFRQHIQEMLQKQIDSLNDSEWQHSLDEYFHTERFYPGNGAEPLPISDSQEDEFAREEKIAEEDENSDDIGEWVEVDDDIDDEDIDSDDPDEVDSNEESEDDEGENPQPMTGDSPSHQTMNISDEPKRRSSDVNIVFPDDYKDHN